jgi:hypothetical protein
MLYIITKASVKRVRGSLYATLLLKVDPDDAKEKPKRMIVFNKHMMNAVLSGNVRQLNLNVEEFKF